MPQIKGTQVPVAIALSTLYSLMTDKDKTVNRKMFIQKTPREIYLTTRDNIEWNELCKEEKPQRGELITARK